MLSQEHLDMFKLIIDTFLYEFQVNILLDIVKVVNIKYVAFTCSIGICMKVPKHKLEVFL